MTFLFSRSASRPLSVGCLVLLILGASGCGGAKGDLSGSVSYKGKPLAVGSVLLIGADTKPRTAWIEADGSYHFADVPVGEVKLAVYSPDPAKKDKRRKSDRKKPVPKDEPIAQEWPVGDRTKWFAIPAEYGDVDHSGLRVTIHPGPNTYPLDMK
jgi:hypothetical protein